MAAVAIPEQQAALHGSVYPLPYDDPEKIRLRKQHESLVAIMHNNPIHSPIHRLQPKKIVDVGCGINADMTVYFAHQFPEAEVYGVDMSPVRIPEEHCPKNVTFIQGNILQLIGTDPRLEEGTIDFVYSRLLTGGMQSWNEYASAIHSLVRPGGWAEMHDFPDWHFYVDDNPVPVSSGWDWVEFSHKAVARKLNLDLGKFGRMNEVMERVGFENADIEEVRLPWDQAPGRPEAQLFVSQGREQWQWALTHVMELLVADENEDVQKEILNDYRRTLTVRDGMWLPFYAAWAQKPL